MFKLIDKLVFVLSLAGILGLAGAYCSRYINPNTFVLSSLLGLGYPYLLVVNFLLMLYWLARWKKWHGLCLQLF
ncbi:MAG: hypothetical protein LIO65_05385 [Odoribacter sp.]|nr:hypothetical protein [Odoribacter sp.]